MADESNPYESPHTPPGPATAGKERLAFVLITGLVILISIGAIAQLSLSFLGLLFEPLRPAAGLMSYYFGWIGLIIGLNAVHPLVQWLRRSERKALLGGAVMLFVTAAADVFMLIIQASFTQTKFLTPTFQEAFRYTGRAPYAWACVVLPFTLAGLYALWLWWRHPVAGAAGTSAGPASPEQR